MSDTLDAAIAADVRARVASIRTRIAAAAKRAGRDPADITLVGAAKRQPIERVAAAVLAGVHDLGHNYVQEAQSMREALDLRLRELGSFKGSSVGSSISSSAGPSNAPANATPGPSIDASIEALPSVRWRMIGHLQSNKAGAALEVFDTVDAVDRLKLARALDRRARSMGRSLDIGLQVNLTGETQKSGLPESEVPALLEACGEFECIRVVLLMTMPRASSDPENARAVFARLRELRDRLRGTPGADHLSGLSMGMSGDFEMAVEEGATLVRVGTALFGKRALST